MAEYIEREAAINCCFAITTIIKCGISESDAKRILEAFNEIPAADVRPVVLCRDCKYWKQWDNTTHYLCTYVAGAKFIRNADDFCSRGEKGES